MCLIRIDLCRIDACISGVCVAGQERDDRGDCVPCDRGTHKPRPGEEPPCRSCPERTYQPHPGQTHCEPCLTADQPGAQTCGMACFNSLMV